MGQEAPADHSQLSSEHHSYPKETTMSGENGQAVKAPAITRYQDLQRGETFDLNGTQFIVTEDGACCLSGPHAGGLIQFPKDTPIRFQPEAESSQASVSPQLLNKPVSSEELRRLIDRIGLQEGWEPLGPNLTNRFRGVCFGQDFKGDAAIRLKRNDGAVLRLEIPAQHKYRLEHFCRFLFAGRGQGALARIPTHRMIQCFRVLHPYRQAIIEFLSSQPPRTNHTARPQATERPVSPANGDQGSASEHETAATDEAHPTLVEAPQPEDETPEQQDSAGQHRHVTVDS